MQCQSQSQHENQNQNQSQRNALRAKEIGASERASERGHHKKLPTNMIC